MFDVGFWELFVVGVIALIVFGPERLPGLARTAGFWIGRARAAVHSIRAEMEREINADGLRETQRAVRREIEEGTRSVKDAARVTDTTADQQTASSQPSAEETGAARANTQQQTYPPYVEEAPPSSSDSSNADRSEAERTGSNTRQ